MTSTDPNMFIHHTGPSPPSSLKAAPILPYRRSVTFSRLDLSLAPLAALLFCALDVAPKTWLSLLQLRAVSVSTPFALPIACLSSKPNEKKLPSPPLSVLQYFKFIHSLCPHETDSIPLSPPHSHSPHSARESSGSSPHYSGTAASLSRGYSPAANSARKPLYSFR